MNPSMLPPIPPPDLTPQAQVFCGWDPMDGHQPVFSGHSDSVGIVGPPRYGKTSGLVIPAVLWWDGPVVCTSTRTDVLAFTHARRASLAAPAGGQVLVYDPTGSGSRRWPSMRWSPLAGCADPAVCYRRVAALTGCAGGRIEDGDHWRAGAASILRGYFHAAALAGLPLAEVRRWLAGQQVRDPVAILRLSESAGAMWADDLDALALLGDRERGSFYSVARNVLEATAEPTVLASCQGTDLDVDEFLATRSTLYVVGPSHHQRVLAPLIVALVDSIAQRAAELAAATPDGRLDPPLLLALDEVANIAPLESLPSLVAEGGGRGTITVWAAQSLAQLRMRYGIHGQAAILAATTCKVIFGGMSIGIDLHEVTSWAGDIPDPSSEPGDAVPAAGTVAAAVDRPSGGRRSALDVGQVQMMPPGHAWLFARSDPPRPVEARPAGLVPALAQLAGSTIAAPGAGT